MIFWIESANPDDRRWRYRSFGLSVGAQRLNPHDEVGSGRSAAKYSGLECQGLNLDIRRRSFRLNLRDSTHQRETE